MNALQYRSCILPTEVGNTVEPVVKRGTNGTSASVKNNASVGHCSLAAHDHVIKFEYAIIVGSLANGHPQVKEGSHGNAIRKQCLPLASLL
jgi:hypothetical protein